MVQLIKIIAFIFDNRQLLINSLKLFQIELYMKKFPFDKIIHLHFISNNSATESHINHFGNQSNQLNIYEDSNNYFIGFIDDGVIVK